MVFNSSTCNTSTHMHADYEIHLSLLATASSNQTTTQISRITSTIINTMSTETSYESANFDPTIFSGSEEDDFRFELFPHNLEEQPGERVLVPTNVGSYLTLQVYIQWFSNSLCPLTNSWVSEDSITAGSEDLLDFFIYLQFVATIANSKFLQLNARSWSELVIAMLEYNCSLVVIHDS
uniref:Uncharacterized protein n=1 Tax=Glossina austeni TaxID=7395 RepID=A0A1A9VNT4_GLOAU